MTASLSRSRREYRPATRGRAARATKRRPRRIFVLSLLNLVAVTAVWTLLHGISERWWIGTVATYGPRLLYGVPAAVLLIASFGRSRAAAGMNLAAVLLVLGPIAEMRVPALAGWTAAEKPRDSITIVSCNVQAFQPDFTAVLQEISTHNPDVVAFQEAIDPPPVLESYFAGWHTLHRDKFWIASRYPLRMVGLCGVAAFGRVTALKVEVSGPAGRFYLTDLHLMTPRHGLTSLNWESLCDGSAAGRIEREAILRSEEALVTRAFCADGDPSVPRLVVGDFNTPSTSTLYRTHWGDLINAFDAAGAGYGYTAPCRAHRFWFDGVPWARIDHVLASSHWTVHACEVGSGNGSDHRLIATKVSLR